MNIKKGIPPDKPDLQEAVDEYSRKFTQYYDLYVTSIKEIERLREVLKDIKMEVESRKNQAHCYRILSKINKAI
jgi:hypothetical protein